MHPLSVRAAGKAGHCQLVVQGLWSSHAWAPERVLPTPQAQIQKGAEVTAALRAAWTALVTGVTFIVLSTLLGLLLERACPPEPVPISIIKEADA